MINRMEKRDRERIKEGRVAAKRNEGEGLGRMKPSDWHGGCGCAGGADFIAETAGTEVCFFPTCRWCFTGVRGLLDRKMPIDGFLGNV